LDEETVIAIQWQIFPPVAGNVPCKEILAEEWETQIRLTSKHGVEMSTVSIGVEGG
jgi:hypothetical protein